MVGRFKKHTDKSIPMVVPVAAVIAGLFGAAVFAIVAANSDVSESPQSEETSFEQKAEANDESLRAEDCTSVEMYDEALQECYYECETDEECEAIEAQIDAELAGIFGETDLGQYSGGERPQNTAELASFTVQNGEVDESILSEQDLELWTLFSGLVPSEYVNGYISLYETYDDADDGTAAYVYQLDDNPSQWALGVNRGAMYVDGQLDRTEATRTFIHEFAHILTLGREQVPTESSSLGESACVATFIDEGCAGSQSYIHKFNVAFWADVREQWPGADASEDAIFAFYDNNQDQFVSDYAATNLGEDIAESFLQFVIRDKPNGGEVRDDKVRFFYDFSELTKIRDGIRARIAFPAN